MKRLASSTIVIAALAFAAPAGAVLLSHPLRDNPKPVDFGLDHGGQDYACGDHYYGGHSGNDYSVPFGNQVYASAPGVVAQVIEGCDDWGYAGNPCGGYCGNYVRINHDDGNATLYCHMMNGSLSVAVGDVVDCGHPLGLTASSGSSTGPHVHFALRGGGGDYDPYAGPCSGPDSSWIQQNGYDEGPAPLCSLCSPSPEVCNGVDDDCDGAADEDEVCEQLLAFVLAATYVTPTTTDVDGDGRADACARGPAGVVCALATDAGFAGEQLLVPLSDAEGWKDGPNAGALRMGDVDGDGRADLCARADAGMLCWTSAVSPLGTAIAGPAWSDADGFAATSAYSTIRLADIDGDGRDDLCARGPAGVTCARSEGGGFGPELAGPPWSDANGFASARYYTTLRAGDVDGDGKADLCIRLAAGMECRLSNGDGFGDPIAGPAWSDAGGWGLYEYYGSIRLADVNGDGKADLCARGAAGLRCHFSLGTSFGDEVPVAPIDDAGGWNDAKYGSTLRTGDVDGDGAEDLCARSGQGMTCWRWDGAAFVPVPGPAWSDGAGWGDAKYHGTIRLGDWNRDGKADLCARGAAGFACAPSDGAGFGPGAASGAFSDAGGWGDFYWISMMYGGPRCAGVPEVCNGRDDDCDGLVDEDGACGVGGGGAGAGGAGSAGGGAATGTGGGAATGDDGAWLVDPPGAGATDGASGCAASRRAPTSGVAGLVAAIGLVALVRRRRPRRAARLAAAPS